MRLKETSLNGCPCENTKLCEPVQEWPEQEIFGFGVDSDRWEYYPWDLVTTVAWAEGGDIICEAHAKKARIIAAAPDGMPLTSDASVRAAWTQKVVKLVQDNFIDGITFDYERPIHIHAPEREYYVQIV